MYRYTVDYFQSYRSARPIQCSLYGNFMLRRLSPRYNVLTALYTTIHSGRKFAYRFSEYSKPEMKLCLISFILILPVLCVSTTDARSARCIQIYRPVCCKIRTVAGGNIFTASNRCVCRRFHRGRDIYRGECQRRACAKIYRPVCCNVPGSRLPETISNACVCTKQKSGSILSKGKCPELVVCTFEYDPVCCWRKGMRYPETAGNKCVCGKGRILYGGQC